MRKPASTRNPLTVTVSLADQNFAKTKTIGILNLSLGLCRALTERPHVGRLTLLTNSSLPRIEQRGATEVLHVERRTPERFRRVWWDQFGAYQAARRAGNDWLLLPKGYTSFLRSSPVKLATYIHDAMHDHYRVFYPKAFPPLENLYFLAGMRAAIARSNIILVNTQFTASEVRRVAERWGLRTPPIHVAGIGFEPSQQNYSGPRAGIVVLASRWPHKRTDLALEYMRQWQEQSGFAGPVDWVGQMPEGRKLPERPNWRLHSRLSPDEWSRMRGAAQAVVYFSEYEGFGMPPVEAVLAGASPVYSDLPVTREVMAGAGYTFRNTDGAEFVAALNSALGTPAERVKNWAEQLLARHNWQSVAEHTVEALESAA